MLAGGALSVAAGVAAVIALILATVFAVTAGRGSDRPPQPGADAAGTLATTIAPTDTVTSDPTSSGSPARTSTPPSTPSAPPSTPSALSSARAPVATTSSASVPPSRAGKDSASRATPSTTPSRTSTARSAAPSGRNARSTASTAPARTPPPVRSVTVTGPVLPASVPTALALPSIGVAPIALVDLGLQDDGTLQTPSLDDPASRPGWYTGSPAPGVAGPAIILGHVDSAEYGPGVFFSIGALVPGDPIEVQRADGTVAVFTVDAVRSYAKKDFPTLLVYGNTDTAALRLITCGGIFDPAARSYDRNTVVFAHLTGSRAG